MANLRGRAIVHNVNGISLTAGIVSGTNSAFNQSFTGARTGETKRTMDNNGDPASVYFHGDLKTITLRVVPSATSGAPTSLSAARDSLAAWTTLARGTKVTVVDSDNTAWDGDYNLVSCRETRGSADAAEVEIELENGVANDLTVIPA